MSEIRPLLHPMDQTWPNFLRPNFVPWISRFSRWLFPQRLFEQLGRPNHRSRGRIACAAPQRRVHRQGTQGQSRNRQRATPADVILRAPHHTCHSTVMTDAGATATGHIAGMHQVHDWIGMIWCVLVSSGFWILLHLLIIHNFRFRLLVAVLKWRFSLLVTDGILMSWYTVPTIGKKTTGNGTQTWLLAASSLRLNLWKWWCWGQTVTYSLSNAIGEFTRQVDCYLLTHTPGPGRWQVVGAIWLNGPVHGVVTQILALECLGCPLGKLMATRLVGRVVFSWTGELTKWPCDVHIRSP